MAKFPQKTQQQIAEHVGCAQSYVKKVQSELITSDKLILPQSRKGLSSRLRSMWGATNQLLLVRSLNLCRHIS